MVSLKVPPANTSLGGQNFPAVHHYVIKMGDLGLGPHHRFALWLNHFRIRLDIVQSGLDGSAGGPQVKPSVTPF